ncbi:phage tail protein [Acinetobacter sp. HY1485]|uniref:phage tail protein n=1 Tax=Acinetobacter sp. HY1485 TaxID=2970918 RepID=UPI0022B975E1|nr:phage tail protein [Acinetobacter sp. HY1485]
MSQYYTLLTESGKGLITQAINSKQPLNITAVAVGDGNGQVPNPDDKRTALVGEKARVKPNSVSINRSAANQLIIDVVIPAETGGFYIRETGIYVGNTLIAIGNHPPMYKPSIDDGSVAEYTLRTIIAVENTTAINLTLDQSLVFVTQKSVTDNLNNDDPVAPLSARQGKILKDAITAAGIDLRLLGAVGDGITNDEKFVREALTLGYTQFHGGKYKVSDPQLVQELQSTSGSAFLVYAGIEYPFGDIQNQALKLNVPSVFSSIQLALNWLEHKRIKNNSSVDIIVADGEYRSSASITHRVRDYTRLSIRGNETDPSKCILYVDNRDNHDGFFFSDSTGIGWLNGFTIIGTQGWIKKGQWNSQIYGAGVRAIGGAQVTLGTSLIIDKMYYGLRAMYGASIIANGVNAEGTYGGGIKVTNAGDVAFHAYAASMQVNCAEAYDTAHTIEGLGFGFCAEAGGFIICEYAKANGNLKAGFYALSNGTAWAHGVSASFNKYGVLAWGGTVECNTLGAWTTLLTENTDANIYCTYKGFIGANKAICKTSNYGVLCDKNATADITAVTVTDNTLHGVAAIENGTITGSAIRSERNKINGFHAENAGYIYAPKASSNDNGQNGFFAKRNSKIIAPNFGGAGNQYFCYPIQSSANFGLSQSGGSYILDSLLASGDGNTDDTACVRSAFDTDVTEIPKGDYKITDKSLIARLRFTQGEGNLVYNGVKYPAGDIINTILDLKVPEIFPSIQDAFDWLEKKRIVGNSAVNILVADGKYNILSAITSKVFDGNKLTIRGNETDPSKCILNIDNTANHDGFLFSEGYGVSWLNGFTINGTKGWIKKGQWNDQCFGSGIRAIGKTDVKLGANLIINKMYYGIRAMNGASIISSGSGSNVVNTQGGGIKVTNAGAVAFHAYAATLDCQYSEAYDTAHTTLGAGFCAEAAGVVTCHYSKADNNVTHGFCAFNKSIVYAKGVSATLNQNGIYAEDGTIECHTTTDYQTRLFANKNAGLYATLSSIIKSESAILNLNKYGLISEDLAVIKANSLIVTDNTIHGIYAKNGGQVSGKNLQCSYNKSNGFHAEDNAQITAPNAIASNNAIGFYANRDSKIVAIGLTGTDNQTFCSPVQVSKNLGDQNNSRSTIIDALNIDLSVQGFDKSLDTNGYQKLPSGLILQWLEVKLTKTQVQTVNFPITFPNAILKAFVSQTGRNTGSNTLNIDNRTTSSITIYNGDASTTQTVTAEILVLGK